MRLFSVFFGFLLCVQHSAIQAAPAVDQTADRPLTIAPQSVVNAQFPEGQLHWILELRIDTKQIIDFKELMVEMVAAAKLESGTLVYEWYFSEDNSRCIINERYRNSSALLAHMRASGRFSERFLAAAKITRLRLLGDPDAEVRAALVGLNAEYLPLGEGFYKPH